METKRRNDSTTSFAVRVCRGNQSSFPKALTNLGSRTSTFETQADHRRRSGSRTTVSRNHSSDRKICSTSALLLPVSRWEAPQIEAS